MVDLATRSIGRSVVVRVATAAVLATAGLVGLADLAAPPASAAPSVPTAYVGGSSTVTPVNLATAQAGSTIPVPFANLTSVAITPDGTTAFEVGPFNGDNTVHPIDTATNAAGAAIGVAFPAGQAVTPDGTFLYVASARGVTPIHVATRAAGPLISFGGFHQMYAVAIRPDGATAYVTDAAAGVVYPIDLATSVVGAPIAAPSAFRPQTIAITPDGTFALVAGDSGVTPIDLATNVPRPLIPIAGSPRSIAITPDGTTAYVVTDTGGVVPITNSVAGTPIPAASGSEGIAITPDGTTAYVAQRALGTTLPINLATRTPGTPITGTPDASSVAIVPAQAPVAHVTVTPARAGAATTLDASTSTAGTGTITKYAWTFGDGATQTTAGPTTTHVYALTGTYPVSVTVTDSAGTSTTRVSTGTTVLRNGGPTAVATAAANVPGPASYTAYVVNNGDDSVTPVNLATNTPGAPIPVGDEPTAIAITPDGTKAYVTNSNAASVTPITLATNTPGTPIRVGTTPWSVAVTPDGSTAWVANQGSGTVTPITTATGKAGTAVVIPAGASYVTVAPDGSTLFVTSGATITPLNLTTGVLGAPLSTLYNNPDGTVITPDGGRLVTANEGIGMTVLDRVSAPDMYSFSGAPYLGSVLPRGIAITPDGATAFVAYTAAGDGGVIPVNTDPTSGDIGAQIHTTTRGATGVGITPDGGTAIVTNLIDNTITLVSTSTRTAGAPIPVGALPWAVAVTPDQSPVARLHVDRAPLGQLSTLDASASTVVFGTRASYAWDFGDGTTATTTNPVVQHVYADANLTPSVTVTDSAGTSVSRVFTGQTMSRNGSARATASAIGPLAATAPALTTVTPAAGPLAGGTAVTIAGSNLTGVTDVAFGGVSVPFTLAKNGATITTTSPAAPAGVVDIVVTNAAGSSAITPVDHFTTVGSTPTVTCSTPQCTAVVAPPDTPIVMYASTGGATGTVSASSSFGNLGGACNTLAPVVYTVSSSGTTLTAITSAFAGPFSGVTACVRSGVARVRAAASTSGVTAAATTQPALKRCNARTPVPPCAIPSGTTLRVLLPANTTYELQVGIKKPAFGKFTPTSAAVGEQVTIKGARLDQVTAVMTGGIPAPIVTQTATLLVITVPDGAATGQITLAGLAGSTTKKKPLLTVLPAP